LQPFRCVEQPDGRSLVYSDLSVYCFEKDWNENVKISSIYMVEFLFLIPGIIVALMIRFRNQIGSEEEREWIGSLTNAYRPGVFWWDFVSMLKKLFLSLSLSLNKKSLFFCAVLSLFHIVETILKPYKLESQAKLNNVWAIFTYVIMFLGTTNLGQDSLSKTEQASITATVLLSF